MKTADLTGAQLDFWVAKAEGKDHIFISAKFGACWDNELTDDNDSQDGIWSPSLDWAIGGPIIERNTWLLPYESQAHVRHLGAFSAQTPAGFERHGPTPLIAAMRAFVASRYGDEVPEAPQ